MLRQQARGLELEEGCGGDQKFTGLVQGSLRALGVEGLQVSEELIGHFGERNVGDIEFAARNPGSIEDQRGPSKLLR